MVIEGKERRKKRNVLVRLIKMLCLSNHKVKAHSPSLRRQLELTEMAGSLLSLHISMLYMQD